MDAFGHDFAKETAHPLTRSAKLRSSPRFSLQSSQISLENSELVFNDSNSVSKIPNQSMKACQNALAIAN